MARKLGVVENKVLKALSSVKNQYDIVEITNKDISCLIGYGDNGGGSISNALELLELKGKICKIDKWTYRVLV